MKVEVPREISVTLYTTSEIDFLSKAKTRTSREEIRKRIIIMITRSKKQ